MNVGTDLDGVLYPWHLAVYRYLCEIGKISDVSNNDFWSNYKLYVSEDYMEYIATLPFLYNRIIISPDIVKKLRILESLGTSIYYVTGRPLSVSFSTENFLKRYDFPQRQNLIFSKDKSSICKQMEIDFFVEDQAEKMQSLLNNCKVYGIRQPYNIKDEERLSGLGIEFTNSCIEAFDKIIAEILNGKNMFSLQ